MILQALTHYYDRLKDDPESGIPPFGFGREPISWALVLDRDGNLVQIRDLREAGTRTKIAKRLVVPQAVIRSSTKFTPNFMWDNTGYVLGVDAKGKPEQSATQFDAFRSFHHLMGDGSPDKGMQAVLRFLDGEARLRVMQHPNWDEIAGVTKEAVFCATI